MDQPPLDVAQQDSVDKVKRLSQLLEEREIITLYAQARLDIAVYTAHVHDELPVDRLVDETGLTELEIQQALEREAARDKTTNPFRLNFDELASPEEAEKRRRSREILEVRMRRKLDRNAG